MSHRIFARRPGRRPAALLSLAAIAATVLVSTAGGASAVVTRGAGLTPDGIPTSLQDSQGVALAPCDVAARCGGVAFDPTDATYFSSDAQVGPIRAVNAVTAGVAPGSPLAVSQINKYKGTGLVPGRYTIKDPWGTVSSCSADAGGTMDCRLTVKRISQFLVSSRGGAGFVGNGVANTTFVGSPTGFNKIQITGPAGFKATATHSIITGKMLAATPMSAINTTALTLGRPRNAAPVVKNVHYTSFGTADAVPTVQLAGANATAFKVRNPCGTVASGTGCNISVAFRPQQHVNKTVQAKLIINDNGLAAPRTVALTGVGLVR
jgi:hypothetical protein